MYTRLEIINAMLATIGLASVADMDTQHPAYEKASATLDRINKAFQTKPYWFNTATVTLRHNPDTGEVVTPTYATHCDPVDRGCKLVMRGNRMYDPDNRTFFIGKDVLVRLREYIPVELLPAPAQEYVQALARVAFYTDRGGSEPKLTTYKQDVQMTLLEFKKENLRNQGVNYFDTHLMQVAVHRPNRVGVGDR